MFGLKKEDGQYVFRAAVHTDQLFLNLYLGNRRIRQIPLILMSGSAMSGSFGRERIFRCILTATRRTV